MRLFLLAALSAVLALVAVFLYDDSNNMQASCTERFCPALPLCAQSTRTFAQRVRCSVGRRPLDVTAREYRQYVSARLQRSVSQSMRGQLLAPSVLELVRYKLSHPFEPMVLHFAGDNGVGKTRLAELISLAYAQRCGDEACSVGDSTLVLSGTGYDGLTTAEFRKAVVDLVTRHAQDHPRDGVIIINELSSLDPSKVRVLLPLLGRASEFPEHPEVKLSTQLVILTTDFGREGRTRGKSLSEMRSFIDSEFAELYSAQSASYVRTLPFLPISLETAAAIARVSVTELGCAANPPLRLAITDAAVLWLVERTKAMLSAENGRVVAQEARLHVGALVERLQAGVLTGESDEVSRVAKNAKDCSVPSCVVEIGDSGELDLMC